ncbi:hypothetical protein [Streptomyces sp. TLI_105]|uniref:hypothetical protein n=1 Tax=Streptomyces sp. TLI_105 TaxID=1881019 RepID=UPI0008971DE8|nr:hypothetical protein [Streptomyces sp. TLI_105]SEC21628.1 hypothetical protein SAMN05428939_1837 [Streptomyces sp. TLI_105]
MIRHSVRALCAASLVIAPVALAAAPAHAQTTCTVNGVSVSPDPMGVVNGTAGRDYIVCSEVAAGNTVNGLGGDDYIVVNGPVFGHVDGGTGRDYISARSVGAGGLVEGSPDSDYIVVGGTVAPGGIVRGNTGNDYLSVDTNNGTTNGGDGFDVCRVRTGNNPPINCEF